MTGDRRARLQPVVVDLEQIFGERLKAVVGYGWQQYGRVPSLALVASLTLDDLSACAAQAARWHRAGAATPLVLTPQEFERSLDAFPIEYSEILATSELVAGHHPFNGLTVAREDLRRACEVQVKSHLLHLREDFLESGARPSHVAGIVRESAPAFAALLRHLAYLDRSSDSDPTSTTAVLIGYAAGRIGLDARLVSDLLALSEPDGALSVDPVRIFPAYLAAVERLAAFIDQWRQR